MMTSLKFLPCLLAILLFSAPAMAQNITQDNSTETVATPAVSENPSADVARVAWSLPEDSVLNQALSANPPLRSSFAPKLANSPEELMLIDKWIENTSIDHSQNLILKQILLAMPVSVAGPKLVELAKKTASADIQDEWKKWLKNYPEAYESVLRAWLKLVSHDSEQFNQLLFEYRKVNSEDAMSVWGQLVSHFSPRELGKVAYFGLENPFCESTLVYRLLSVWNDLKKENAEVSADNPAILRLMRAYSQCQPHKNQPEVHRTCENRRSLYASSKYIPGDIEEDIDTLSEIVDSLFNASLSRQIVAIDFCRGWTLKQAQILNIYESAKNTTEKAHALRVLQDFCDEKQPARVLDALNKGDETLRLEAASIIVDFPQDAPDTATLKAAFDREIWPETQLKLYQALVAHSASDNDILTLQRAILLDSKRSESIRLAAMNDLAQKDTNAITLDDMSALIQSEAPIELIASVSEHLYASQASSRPTLRKWIQAQQPFNRRLFATFARFVNIDSSEKDPTALELMRSVCKSATEQENLLLPCLNYMLDNAQTDEDQELLQKLQQRKNQVDAMTNLEFAL